MLLFVHIKKLIEANGQGKRKKVKKEKEKGASHYLEKSPTREKKKRENLFEDSSTFKTYQSYRCQIKSMQMVFSLID